MLIEILEKYTASFYPVLGENFNKKDFCPLSLSVDNVKLKQHDITHYEGLDTYVQSILNENKAKIAFGGYGEHRAIYTASEHFTNEAEIRCIHLGIDLWTKAGTPVYAPLDGIVHSFQYNNQPLDYGATIILQHELEGIPFYTLYGHLSLKSLENRYKNEKILRGVSFATLGEKSENGGWSPHLHLQLIQDMLGWEGDFPGVATRLEAQKYLDLCPSPSVFVKFKGGF
jgi:peptidoglycan LD-endopeptidase LytH